MNYDYDVIVLGAGPGGYETAIRCAQYGLKTALVEAREMGGTCLNRGCIPTKALLHGAEVYDDVNDAKVFGINVQGVSVDFGVLAQFKDKQVSTLRRGIEGLERANGVKVVKGFGKLADANTIVVGEEKLTGKNIILATGSEPARPPIPGIENADTSDEVLAWTTLPKSVCIVGGGVIGIEFATLLATLGVKVTVLEMLPDILPGVDKVITDLLRKTLAAKGVEIYNQAKVTAFEKGAVCYELDGKALRAECERSIVSVGRRPMTKNIGLEELGMKMNRAFVDVDEYLRTSIPNIYAIGDITGKIQLAHVATAQGMAAAANCAGKKTRMNYNIVPACIYTHPEIAYIGKTAEAAKKDGREVEVGRFDIAGNGRSMVMNEHTGLAMIVTDKHTGEILGAQIMAPHATDMIGEIAVAMRSEATIEELSDTIHPHPTVCEMIMEAAHDVEGLSCNAMPRKKK